MYRTYCQYYVENDKDSICTDDRLMCSTGILTPEKNFYWNGIGPQLTKRADVLP